MFAHYNAWANSRLYQAAARLSVEQAAVVIALLHVPAHAQEDSRRVVCKVITDRAAELVRTGETGKARAMKPQLQECIQHQRAILDQAAQRIVDEYDTHARN